MEALGKKMTTAISSIVKDWIQYLKNNKIVELKPQPNGKLKYNRDATVRDLMKFLDVKTDYPNSLVRKAIRSVFDKK